MVEFERQTQTPLICCPVSLMAKHLSSRFQVIEMKRRNIIACYCANGKMTASIISFRVASVAIAVADSYVRYMRHRIIPKEAERQLALNRDCRELNVTDAVAFALEKFDLLFCNGPR